MPEENFEEQARKLTEPFIMEPQPAVWQRVKAAIAPPKRRRRALLWWWLLPLCVAGGLSVWFVQNGVLVMKEKPSLANEKQIKKESEKQHNNTLNDGNKKVLQKRKVNMNDSVDLHGLSQTKNELFAVKIDAAANRLADESQRKEKEQTLLNNQPTMYFDTTEISNKKAVPLAEKKAKLYNECKIDSSLIASSNDISAATDTTSSKAVAARILGDSAQQKKDSSVVAHHQKKKAKHPYSLGVLAELGTTSLGSPLFGNTDKNSQPAAFSFPGSAGVDFNSNSGNATVIQNIVKSGVDMSFGLSVKKKLSKSVYINGQIAYRYQQFSISQTFFIDTTSRNPTGTTTPGGGSYYHTNATERLHFANIYTGIGWQFFTKKKTSLSLEAGIDNSLLLSLSQKQNGGADSVKSLSTGAFYKWQPSIQLLLPFDWYAANKTRFELSPFVRFGVRRFQKNSASSQHNHLASSGVQFIYFFK